MGEAGAGAGAGAGDAPWGETVASLMAAPRVDDDAARLVRPPAARRPARGEGRSHTGVRGVSASVSEGRRRHKCATGYVRVCAMADVRAQLHRHGSGVDSDTQEGAPFTVKPTSCYATVNIVGRTPRRAFS